MEENLKISGIKCDNEACDYRDDSVQFVDYPQWLDKECPNCGDNLLTQEDYDTCLYFINLSKIITERFPEGIDEEKVVDMMKSMGMSEEDLQDVMGNLFEIIKETKIKNIQ